MDIDLLPQRHLRHRLALFVGVIADDLNPARQRFLRRIQVVTGLRHHIPGRRAAAVGEAHRSGVSVKLPLNEQPLQLADALRLAAGFAHLRDAQCIRIGGLRRHLGRVAFQRQNAHRGRVGGVALFFQRLDHILQHLRRDRRHLLREVAGNQIQPRRILHQRIEIVLRPPGAVIRLAQLLPARLQQRGGFVVHLQQAIGRGQIERAQIGFPLFAIAFLQRILHRRQRVGGHFALQRQQVNRPAAQAQQIQIVETAGRQLAQRAVGFIQHAFRQGVARRFGFEQILHHIRRDERIGIRR